MLPETTSNSGELKEFQLKWDDFAFGKIAKSATRPRLGKLFVLTFLSGSTFTIFTFAFQPFFLKVLNRDTKELAMMFALVGILGFITQVFALDSIFSLARNNFSLDANFPYLWRIYNYFRDFWTGKFLSHASNRYSTFSQCRD